MGLAVQPVIGRDILTVRETASCMFGHMRAIRTVVSVVACTLLTALSAHAEPRIGAAIPAFSGADLAGRVHATGELTGRPTLLLVVASRGADPKTRRWLDEITPHNPNSRIRVLTLITMRLPPIVPVGLVRSAVRAKVARVFWPDVWLDGNGMMKRALDLRGDNARPYVLLLDGERRIVASVNDSVDTRSAPVIWSAMAAQNHQ